MEKVGFERGDVSPEEAGEYLDSLINSFNEGHNLIEFDKTILLFVG